MVQSQLQVIKRILKRWQDAQVPNGYEGGVVHADNSAIDDGAYGDPHIDTTPDFIKKDTDGWQRLDNGSRR